MARGNTWWKIDCIFEAPSTQRCLRGSRAAQHFNEARVAMMIVGKVIRVRTRPPTSGEDCVASSCNWMKTASPRIPNTMDGTAARFEIFTSIRSVQTVLRRKFLKIDRGGNADGQATRHSTTIIM